MTLEEELAFYRRPVELAASRVVLDAVRVVLQLRPLYSKRTTRTFATWYLGRHYYDPSGRVFVQRAEA